MAKLNLQIVLVTDIFVSVMNCWISFWPFSLTQSGHFDSTIKQKTKYFWLIFYFCYF